MGYSLHLSANRRASAVAIGVLSVVAVMPSRAHAEFATFAGACTLDLRLTAAPPADLSPTATDFTYSAFGTCVVNEVITTGGFSGSARVPLGAGWTCAAGVATGAALFDTGHPSFGPIPVEVSLAVSGGSLTVGAHQVPVFEGAGELAQDPSASTGCLGGTPQGTTLYTGVFAFQDPRFD